MKKIFDVINIVLFFAIISVISLSSILLGSDDIIAAYGKTDRRQVTADFPMAKGFHTLYSKTSLIIGSREFGSIYYDKENQRLIDRIDAPSDESMDRAASSVNNFFYRYGGRPFYIMIVPTASGIYRSDIAVNCADQQLIIDRLYYTVDQEIVPLDAFNALYSARDDYIYFRTDRYWTQLGAYHAYAAAASKLGFQPYTAANYDIDYTHVEYQGALADKSGVYAARPDSVNAYKCKYGSYIKSLKLTTENGILDRTNVYRTGSLKTNDKYSYFLGADDYKCAEITTTNDTLPSLLIVCSDYANCFAPFLAPHYSKIAMVDVSDLESGERVSDYADPTEYDSVLFLLDFESFFKLPEIF